MPVNRSIWKLAFDEANVPRLPCPECEGGRVTLAKDGLVMIEPAYSSGQHHDHDWERSWVAQRFSARMVCDEPKCGEIVFITGDMFHGEQDTGYGETIDVDVMQPRTIFPAPPLFPIPRGVPPEIAKELKLSFQLYWTDMSACIARLRTSVEQMLDHQQVPRANGAQRLNLFNRIVAFQGITNDADLSAALQGLRNVGNLGTHGGEIPTSAIFDAMDVYEHVLRVLYDKSLIGAKAAALSAL